MSPSDHFREADPSPGTDSLFYGWVMSQRDRATATPGAAACLTCIQRTMDNHERS
jgi:hypothetical protein